MKPVEVQLPDDVSVSHILEYSDRDFEAMLGLQKLQDMRQKTAMRKYAALFLFPSGAVVLLTSLGLIVGQAIGVTHLPESTITTLVGSVAVEFVGMLWLVIKYLFEKD